MLSVARSPEGCWPVLPPEGVTVRIVPRTPAGLFPFFALWPLHLVKTSAKCAPGDEPSRRPPSARRGAGGSPDPCLRPPPHPRHPPAPPRAAPPPVLRRSPLRAAQSKPSARFARRDSGSRAGLGSTSVSLPGRTLLGMLSAPPGTRISRGRDQFSGFSRLPRGRWGGEAGRQSVPCSSPPPSRRAAAARTARCGPIRGGGRSSARHALPLGLLRVISRNSVQRGERRGRRREGQRRRERARACKTGRSALESPKHERDNRLGIFQATVIPESSRRLTITPTLTFPTRS